MVVLMEMVEPTQISRDGGIDGVIKEDKLGLDMIYIQAKKWENTVSRQEIDKFIGVLSRKRAKKGVFITTSNFSSDALKSVDSLDSKIVLVDGEKLGEFDDGFWSWCFSLKQATK
jgi:restriction system protein